MKLSPPLRAALSAVATIVAVAMLQLAFGLFYWLPERNLSAALAPSLDMLATAGLLLACNQAGLSSPRSRWALLTALSSLLFLSVLLGVAQAVALGEFGYDFTLAYHTGKIKALFKMMYEAQSLPLFTLSMGLLVAVIAATMAASSWALVQVFTITRTQRRSRRMLAALLASYGLLGGLVLGMHDPVSAELVAQANEYWHRDQRMAAEAKRLEAETRTITYLERGETIRRPTILVFVIESYGQILFEDSKFASYRDFITDSEQSLREAGFSTRSTVYTSPTFGGSSWLANASILCRVRVATEKVYASLFKSKVSCMPKQFTEAGYESAIAASNTTSIPDDYAALLPFDNFFPRDSFGYKGPRMAWSYMPDQFVVDTIDRQIMQVPSTKPRFLYYNLTSSHHPWSVIPTYLEDWDTIGDGSLYEHLATKRFPGNAFLGGKAYDEGFEASIEYSMQTIVGYLRKLPKDSDILAIVLGDHQPREPVASMKNSPWTVPLHVITRDQGLLANFARLGYLPGLLPQASDSPAPLHKLVDHLIMALNDIRVVEKQVPRHPQP